MKVLFHHSILTALIFGLVCPPIFGNSPAIKGEPREAIAVDSVDAVLTRLGVKFLPSQRRKASLANQSQWYTDKSAIDGIDTWNDNLRELPTTGIKANATEAYKLSGSGLDAVKIQQPAYKSMMMAADNTVCYASDDGGNTLRTMKRDGSGQTLIGSHGVNAIEAIEFSLDATVLYGANASSFGTINLTTGAYTSLGVFGVGSGSRGNISFSDVDGLALDGQTGIMYGSVRVGDGTAPDDVLIAINMATGNHIPNFFGPNVDYVVINTSSLSSTGGINVPDIDDIAVDPTTGKMYGVANASGNSDQLIEINKATGAVTYIGRIKKTAAAGGANINDVEGFSFYNDGTLYITTGDGGAGADANALWTINILNGEATKLANFSSGSDYEGVACLTGGVNTITGKVFNDQDGDGTFNGSDVGQSGVTLSLFKDTNGNGVVDSGEPLLQTTTSDANGDYSFKLAPEGTYVVQINSGTLPANSVLSTDNVEAANFVGFGNTDPNNNFGFAQSADLSLTKTTTTPAVPVGQNITFTLTVSNAGPAEASGVSIIDVLPSGMTYVSQTGDGTFNAGNGIWTVPNIPNGSTASIDITVTIVQAGAIVNNAEIFTANNSDPDSQPNNGITTEDDYATLTVTGEATDLSLTKTVDNAQPSVGDDITYTVTVLNSGPTQATNVIVEDILPADVTYKSQTGDGTYNEVNGLWTLPVTLAANNTATINITVTVTGGTVLSNNAQIIAVDQGDPDSTPNNNKLDEDDQDFACISIPIELASGESYTLNTIAGLTGIQWYLDGNAISGADQTTFVVSFPNYGSYSYTAVDAAGCAYQQDCPIIFIEVSQPPVAENDADLDNAVGTDAVIANILANDKLSDGSQATVSNTSVVLIDPATGNPTATPNTVTVSGQGVWTYVPGTGELTFNPDAGFTTDPTPIDYRLTETLTGLSDDATVTVTYTEVPPVAENDADLDNAVGTDAVIANILANDKLSDGSQATVSNTSVVLIDPATGNPTATPNTVTVSGQGVWTYVPGTGELTFNPDAGFTTDPTPIDYRLTETLTGLSDDATVTVTYTEVPPVAENDADLDNAVGTDAVIANILANDKLSDGSQATVSNTSVVLIDPATGNPTATPNTVTVSGQGVWTYVPGTGELTFNPDAGFTTDPTPIDYRLTETLTGLSDDATVTVTYTEVPPVAENDADLDNAVGTDAVIANILANDKLSDGSQATVSNTSVVLIDPATGNPTATPNTVTVSGQGVWTYVPGTGELTFNPDAGFTTDPTPIDYRLTETLTGLSDDATVTVTYTEVPPVAENDADLDNAVGTDAVIANILANDKLSDGSQATVSNTSVVLIDPATGNPTATPNTVTVSGQGVWTYVPGTGELTFNPDAGFTTDPTPIDYRLTETLTGLSDDATVTVTYRRVLLLPQAYLQGSLIGVFSDPLMRDDLRVKNLIPSDSPYPAKGFTELTASGTLGAGVLAVTGADAIVDWVFVELRDATDPTLIVDSRSALIQRDGDIVSEDGVSALTFNQVNAGSYYVAVKHRNHLGVMSKDPIAMSTTATVIDFRQPLTPTFDFGPTATPGLNQAQVVVDQGVALWAGNALYDKQVVYQGTTNDLEPVYQLVIDDAGNFFDTPFYKLKSYNDGDIDMNGETIFQGTKNDIEFIYQNVIKNHPGNALIQPNFIIREQLPENSF